MVDELSMEDMVVDVALDMDGVTADKDNVEGEAADRRLERFWLFSLKPGSLLVESCLGISSDTCVRSFWRKGYKCKRYYKKVTHTNYNLLSESMFCVQE